MVPFYPALYQESGNLIRNAISFIKGSAESLYMWKHLQASQGCIKKSQNVGHAWRILADDRQKCSASLCVAVAPGFEIMENDKSQLPSRK